MSTNPSIASTANFWSPSSARTTALTAASNTVEYGLLPKTATCLPCSIDKTHMLCSDQKCDPKFGRIHNCAFVSQAACAEVANELKDFRGGENNGQQLLGSNMSHQIHPTEFSSVVNQSLSQPSYAGAVESLYSSF